MMQNEFEVYNWEELRLWENWRLPVEKLFAKLR
jgi:hypothetical protein